MATTKKTTKVQTPIDERETFVSLQKNFADNEKVTQQKLKTLYELQSTDMEIDKLMQLRGELPEEVAILESELESRRAKYARSEQNIEDCKEKIEYCKKEIKRLEEEMEMYRTQLQNITNSREYDSIQKELENEELLKAIAEKHINEAYELMESSKNDMEKIGDAIAIRESDLEAKREELSTIVESTSKEETALLNKRKGFISKLDERTVSAYERIRNNTHNHLAVVSLFPKKDDGTYGDACGGCFHTITPQRLIDVASGKKLVICEHCGRIVVNPEI